MLNHLSTKVRVLYVCVVRVLREPAEQGEHLHTVAQAFCLYTRLLPSNASRLSRLWPPKGSRGALPLKSQLCLILSPRQIFHSPAVHLRSMEHSPFTFSHLYFFEYHCANVREHGTMTLLSLSKQHTWLLTSWSKLYKTDVSNIRRIRLNVISLKGTRCRIFHYSSWVPTLCTSAWP